MHITGLHCTEINLELSEPYTIAYEEFSSISNVLVTIETSSGISGYGIAAPAPEVTGETTADVLHVLRTQVEPQMLTADPLRRLQILHQLTPVLSTLPATRSALDAALYDIIGKVAGIPVWKLLGGYRNAIATSITIGILPEQETIERAKEYIRQGFHILKIKGGRSLEEDCARLHKLRETFGQEIVIRFDANQGYSVDDTISFVQSTEHLNLELIEQPVPTTDPQLLGTITHSCPLPIMADESLLTVGDAFKMVKNELVDMVNIKLMKVGGITEAIRITNMAVAADIDVMIGCMDEVALGIAAGLHVALAYPGIRYADLDGHIDILDDPTSQCLTLKDGILYPSDLPGFGYTPI